MRQVMPHRNNIVAHHRSCKSFLELIRGPSQDFVHPGATSCGHGRSCVGINSIKTRAYKDTGRSAKREAPRLAIADMHISHGSWAFPEEFS
jgi:hypothetical protein